MPPRGELFSWTVVHASPLPGFSDLGAYVVAIVELESSPVLRMVGRLTGGDVSLEIGMPLRAEFEQVSDHVVLPLWTPS